LCFLLQMGQANEKDLKLEITSWVETWGYPR